jgi:hypothetical protein
MICVPFAQRFRGGPVPSNVKKKRFPDDEVFYADLARVLGEVLEDVAPEQSRVFRKVGPALLRQEAETRASVLSGAADEFATSIEVSLVAAHVIAGTLSLVDIYLHTSRLREEGDTENKFRREWCNLLVEHGLDPELARMIPVKFSAEIMRFLLKYRDGKRTE